MNPGTNAAVSAAIRMSQAQASESPAPAAAPLTAAITGFSSARIVAHVRVVARLQMPGDVAVDGLELLHVLACAEALAGAGDHDRTHVGGPRLVERGVQRLVHRGREGVVGLGPVEGDRQDAAVAAGLDLRHAPQPNCQAATTGPWER